MRVNIVHRHVLDTMVILEEGNFPHRRCARCDMLVPRQDLNGQHPGTVQCKRGAERKRRRLAEADTQESAERAFEAYGEPIKNVTEFKYLGRVLTAGDDEWLAVVGNLGKAQRSWGRLSRVLGQEGVDPKVSRMFYTGVAQAVLLFGAETWVLTQRMEKALDSFQSRVARMITGRQPRQRKDGAGNTHRWRGQGRKQEWQGYGHPSHKGRILSRNILQSNRFWTYASGPLGGQEHGCLGRGGSSPG